MRRKRTLDEFICKANMTHNGVYDYSKFIYTNDRTVGTITCKIHGDFTQSPNKHLKGQGCPKCGRDKTRQKQSIDFKTFIERSVLIHGNKYDYSNSKYINAHTRVELKCPIHGIFYQTPDKHLMGRGCHQCGMEYSMGNNRWERKVFIFPNGRIEKLQGYEPWTMEYLLSLGVLSDDIKTGSGNRPVIKYGWEGKIKRFYPDCYISSSNTIVETKSDWTWNMETDKNKSKISGSLNAGYGVRFIIWGHNKKLISDTSFSSGSISS